MSLSVPCGICLSHKEPLYCRNCINYKLFKSNLLSINSDFLNQLSQEKISYILKDCFDKENEYLLEYLSTCSQTDEIRKEVSPAPIHHEDNLLDSSLVPSPDASSISSLASHLLKFHISIKKQNISNIQASKDELSSDIDQLKHKIERLRKSKNEKLSKLAQLNDSLAKSKDEATISLSKEINQYKNEKLITSSKLINGLKFNLYQEFLNLFIQRFKHKNQKQFMVQYIPIIEIEQLSSTSLTTINSFLENLIILQIYLSDYLIIDLPFKELVKLLPTSSFYNTLIDNIAESEQSPTAPETATYSRTHISNLDKKLTINNLPLSSKTINNKLRRISLNNTHNISTETLEKPVDTTSQKSNSNSRIIPHKIITKQLNVLNQQELFKFVLILTKILVNFRFIINSITGSTNISFGNHDDLSFLKNIEKLIKLDDFFFKKLEDKSVSLEPTVSKKSVDTTNNYKLQGDKKWGFGSVYQSIVRNNIFKKKPLVEQNQNILANSEIIDNEKLSVYSESILGPQYTNELDIERIMKHIYSLINKREKRKDDKDEWDIIPQNNKKGDDGSIEDHER